MLFQAYRDYSPVSEEAPGKDEDIAPQSPPLPLKLHGIRIILSIGVVVALFLSLSANVLLLLRSNKSNWCTTPYGRFPLVLRDHADMFKAGLSSNAVERVIHIDPRFVDENLTA